MNDVYTLRCFFSLLRSGLWGDPPDELLFRGGNTNWEEIFRLAVSQTVPGLVFDGIEMLPSELRPPRPLFMKWFGLVVQIEQTNDKLNRELANISHLYAKENISFILLKGQGNASIYLRPEHRQCGDLDLYIGKNNYGKVNKIVSSSGIKFDLSTEKHISFTYHDVPIENHRYAARFYNPLQNKKLQKWTNKWLNSPGKTFRVYDTEIAIPSPGFNAIFLLIHSLLHFIPEGIGLRQLCDWARTLKYYSKEIDKQRMVEEIRLLKLEHAFTCFGYIAVNYLGLSPAQIPFPVNKVKEKGEFLLADILKGGNFGYGHEKNKYRPRSKWKGKLYSFRYIRNRCRQMEMFLPTEARWYPFHRMLNLIYKELHRMD